MGAVAWAKAVGKMIDMGAAMDTKLLKAGADAHHAAIGGLPASGVCSEAQLTAINAAIGRMIASVPESKTMDVYNSVSALVDSSVPQYLMSTVKEADAKAAYAALIDFTNVVKGSRQDDCDGLGDGRRGSEGGCPSPREGHRWSGRKGSIVAGRLRSHQRRTWEGNCI